MYSLAFLPSSVPSLTLARSMSPVEMNGSRKSMRSRSACVPFPAPGGPNRIRFSSGMGAAYRATAGQARAQVLLQETLVVAHHQLGLELLHRVQRHPDHDQDRGPA